MVNYEQGKIYKLWSDESDCFYIGSTTGPLYKRLYNHKANINCGKSKTHIDMRNQTNICIELIEDYPCNSRDELNAREGHHIRLHRENLLNQKIPGRTKQEYCVENKEKISKYKNEYYEDNKEEILKRRKDYRESNKDVINLKAKEYRKAKKEAISIWNKEYCEAKKHK